MIGNDKTPPRESTLSGEESAVSVRSFSDIELHQQLKRQRALLSYSDKLPDKGAKIRSKIGDLEYEKQRRMFQVTKMDADNGCQILEQPKSSDMFRQMNTGTFCAHSSDNPKVEAQSVKLGSVTKSKI